MNLIEMLGGYEKAKNVAFLQRAMGLLPHANRTDKALLNYRREHNIFEVGDWVGIKDDSTTWVDKVVSIEYKKIHDSKWNASVTEILVFEDGTKLGVGWAIHATDEEIKAGHRL